MVKLNFDFRLNTPQFELSALRSTLHTLETQFDLLRVQRTAEVERYVSSLDHSSEDADADAQFAYQELEWEVEHTYPRVYRGGTLILIWAAYESGIAEVAEFIAKRTPVRLRLADLRGRTALERAAKYYPEVLRFELCSSKDSIGRLRELELLRNAFAHGNGRLENASVRSRRVLQSMVTSGRLLESFGVVTPTKNCLQWGLSVVEAELGDLVARAKAWDDALPGRGLGPR